jgi:hypothetical protein
LDSRRKDFTQAFQLLTLRTEDRAQYDVESDAHHRGHRREGSVVRPGCELVQSFPFHDGFVNGQPPSMKLRCQQLALCAVPVTGQR